MKRFILVLAVAAVMAALIVAMAAPAFARTDCDHRHAGTAGYSKWWQDDLTCSASETDGVDGDGNAGWHTGPGYGWGSR